MIFLLFTSALISQKIAVLVKGAENIVHSMTAHKCFSAHFEPKFDNDVPEPKMFRKKPTLRIHGTTIFALFLQMEPFCKSRILNKTKTVTTHSYAHQC